MSQQPSQSFNMSPRNKQKRQSNRSSFDSSSRQKRQSTLIRKRSSHYNQQTLRRNNTSLSTSPFSMNINLIKSPKKLYFQQLEDILTQLNRIKTQQNQQTPKSNNKTNNKKINQKIEECSQNNLQSDMNIKIKINTIDNNDLKTISLIIKQQQEEIVHYDDQNKNKKLTKIQLLTKLDQYFLKQKFTFFIQIRKFLQISQYYELLTHCRLKQIDQQKKVFIHKGKSQNQFYILVDGHVTYNQQKIVPNTSTAQQQTEYTPIFTAIKGQLLNPQALTSPRYNPYSLISHQPSTLLIQFPSQFYLKYLKKPLNKLQQQKAYKLSHTSLFKNIGISNIKHLMPYFFNLSWYKQGKQAEYGYFILDGEVELVKEDVRSNQNHINSNSCNNRYSYNSNINNNNNTIDEKTPLPTYLPPTTFKIVKLSKYQIFGIDQYISPQPSSNYYKFTSRLSSSELKTICISYRTLLQIQNIYPVLNENIDFYIKRAVVMHGKICEKNQKMYQKKENIKNINIRKVQNIKKFEEMKSVIKKDKQNNCSGLTNQNCMNISNSCININSKISNTINNNNNNNNKAILKAINQNCNQPKLQQQILKNAKQQPQSAPVKKKKKKNKKKKNPQSFQWWGLAQDMVGNRRYKLHLPKFIINSSIDPCSSSNPRLTPMFDHNNNFSIKLQQFRRKILQHQLDSMIQTSQKQQQQNNVHNNNESPYKNDYVPKLNKIKIKMVDVRPKAIDNAERIKKKLLNYAKNGGSFCEKLDLD